MIYNNKCYSSISQPTINHSIIFYLKFVVILCLLLPLILTSVFFGRILPLVKNWLPVIFHRLLIWLLSIKIEYEGDFQNSKSCNLFVSNHLSYLDIPILGSIQP